MPERIHLSPPDVGVLERDAVASALLSGWVAPVGPHLDEFEHAIAATTGRRHAVATSSGTAALHLALLTAGVDDGSVVITSTFTFAATANAITYCGAEPAFVDVDPSSGNMCPALLERLLGELLGLGRRVSAILPVDIYGKSADHSAIAEVAARFGIPVVVDSAEALGARSAGAPAGSSGVSAIVSFNGNKIITTSGGGMLVTDDDGVATRARTLSTQARLPVAHYEHAEVGYNYRLSNVLAALGLAQLGRFGGMMGRRRQIRAAYRESIRSLEGVAVFDGGNDVDDNCWLTSILIDPATGASPESVGDALAQRGIETRRLWKPMHAQKAFAHCATLTTGTADALFETGLTLPSGSALSDDQLDFVRATLVDALRGRRVYA